MKKQLLTLCTILCFSHYSNAQNPSPNSNANTQWKINGNNASTTDFMGTTNNQSLIFKTNNVERLQLDVQGKLILNSGKEMIINPDGLLRPEKTNPISAYMLRVGGSGHFDGELNTRQLFVQEYITYMKSLKGPSMNVDTIRMDSTRGIFGHTKIFGDVQIKQNLEVLGDATFKNNLKAEKGILFDNINGIRYTPATATSGAIYKVGPEGPTPISHCIAPSKDPWFSFGGRIQLYDQATNVALTMGSDNYGTMIDASGNNGLLINFYCKKNTFINTAWGLQNDATGNTIATQDGGTVYMGAKADFKKSIKIGYTPTGTIDLNTSIEINQNEAMGNGIKLNTYNNALKFITINNTNFATSPFTVYGDGSLNSGKITVNGDATISSLAGITGSGLRGIMADEMGKLVLAPSASIGSAWLLGGNAGGTNNKLGTNDNTDLQIITGTGSEKMRIDAAGNVLINTATSTSPSYKKTLTVNGDVCFANYNNLNPTAGHANDGFSGFEILGGGKTPTRRGISVEEDPNGDYNMFINSNQSAASFNFVNGYAGGLSNTNPFLVRISSDGRTDINAHNNTNKYFVINNLSNKEKPLESFIVYGNGKTEIGKNKITSGAHTDAMLTVDGKIIATSCYITLSNWADYVFAKDYKLPNLYDIEKFYLANKHLPEVPTEKEVIENGIDIGEMNKILLKKIEEITILMVKQQKEIDALKQQNNK